MISTVLLEKLTGSDREKIESTIMKIITEFETQHPEAAAIYAQIKAFERKMNTIERFLHQKVNYTDSDIESILSPRRRTYSSFEKRTF